MWWVTLQPQSEVVLCACPDHCTPTHAEHKKWVTPCHVLPQVAYRPFVPFKYVDCI
jgi:hypothetical protein